MAFTNSNIDWTTYPFGEESLEDFATMTRPINHWDEVNDENENMFLTSNSTSPMSIVFEVDFNSSLNKHEVDVCNQASFNQDQDQDCSTASLKSFVKSWPADNDEEGQLMKAPSNKSLWPAGGDVCVEKWKVQTPNHTHNQTTGTSVMDLR